MTDRFEKHFLSAFDFFSGRHENLRKKTVMMAGKRFSRPRTLRQISALGWLRNLKAGEANSDSYAVGATTARSRPELYVIITNCSLETAAARIRLIYNGSY